jgi:anti-sigma factor RsiW
MINRENYEEFFLSYVDNELPAETRLAVERFAAAHPDLREELEVLLQCRLQPEADETDAVYPDKTGLLQYEESFLYYVDGELDEAGKTKVEELVRRHPEKGLELEHIMKTVSRPDLSIVFPDKESLYQPARRRRLVMMPWLQAGVAAAVLAAIVLLALPRGRKAEIAPAATAAVKNKPAAPVTPSGTSPLYSVKTDDRTRTEATPKNAGYIAASKSAGNKTQAIVAPPKTPPLPAPAVAEIKADTGNASGELAVTAPAHPGTPANMTTATPDKAATPATSVTAVYIPKEQSSFATQALLKDAQAQEDAKNDVADNNMTQAAELPQAQGKTKLRGIFRRVTRAFGKTADRDDDGQRQVSISVFQVALK